MPVATFAFQHTVGAKYGPCGAARDSVRLVRGKPYSTVAGDEEDLSTGARLREDSIQVVRFRWGTGLSGCHVDERTARSDGVFAIP